jgi:hypothetical protein
VRELFENTYLQTGFTAKNLKMLNISQFSASKSATTDSIALKTIRIFLQKSTQKSNFFYFFGGETVEFNNPIDVPFSLFKMPGILFRAGIPRIQCEAIGLSAGRQSHI